MAGKGTNGLLVKENLKHQRSKPVFEEKAEPVLSKCVAHPTKRVWTDFAEAIREAKVRSEITPGLEIVAYKCDECGNAHLCKAQNARAGTVLTEIPVERNLQVTREPIPGNRAARVKLLSKWLADKSTLTTAEITAEFDLHPTTISTYMVELGWTCKKGRFARWSRTAEAAPKVSEQKAPAPAVVTPLTLAKAQRASANAQAFADSERAELDKSIARHPASQLNPWRDVAFDRLAHIPLGDVITTLAAAGLEVRIQARRP